MTRMTARRALRRTSAVVAAFTVVAGAMLVGLAGCFPLEPAPQPTPTGLATPQSVAPRAPLVIPAVLAYCPIEGAVHFTGYWLPTDEVYICRADGRQDTDGVSSYGPWESASLIERPQALLKAYRVADAPARAGTCVNQFRDPDIVWVKRSGVTTAYYAPVDGCGNPSRAATEAYQAARRTLLLDIDRGAPGSAPPTPSQKDVSG